MIKNYFKIAIRQLREQKMYHAAIKIEAFAFSIAACLLIALYIRNELSYDKSWPDANRIFRLIGEYNDKGSRCPRTTHLACADGESVEGRFPRRSGIIEAPDCQAA